MHRVALPDPSLIHDLSPVYNKSNTTCPTCGAGTTDLSGTLESP
jgi:tRNA(Ile2) C34 agmatinyltransferase TiaS